MSVEDRVKEILKEMDITIGDDITEEQFRILVNKYKERYAEMFAKYGDEVAEESASSLVRFLATEIVYSE